MAKKYLSEEMVVDSDDSESSTVEGEKVEAQPTHFEPPRSYIQVKDLKKPQLLNLKEIKSSKKEIWLIKMPKGLDISKIKSIPVDSLGEATDFATGDNKYSIVEDLTASASTTIDSKKNNQKLIILLPDSKSTYKSENGLKVGRFYNIYEKVEIPAINYDKVVVQREDVKQEKDLRMRHFPTGYYIKDFEEAQEPTIPNPDKKRKADDIDDDQKKESKKFKKDKSDKKKKKKKDKKKSD